MSKKIVRLISLVLVACMVNLVIPTHVLAATFNSSDDDYISPFVTEESYFDYVLGPGDLLQVNIIVGDNAVTQSYDLLISQGGTIFFPNIGELKLTGVKVKDVKGKLTSFIKSSFRESFKLSVTLKKPKLLKVYLGGDSSIPALEPLSSYVYVYGQVAKSGRFNYFPGKKLSDYINLAGGPTDRANLGGTTITRNEGGKTDVYNVNASDIMYKGLLSNDLEIKPGDVVSVPANFFYFSDFASFANTILLGLTLYATVSSYLRK